jgi:predicted PurR-regulated permease PerM
MSTRPGSSPNPDFASRVLIAVVITVLILLVLALLWYATYVLLLIFAGILLAILLRSAAEALARHTRLATGWSLTIVVLVLTVAIALLAWLAAARINAQVEELRQQLPQAWNQFKTKASQSQVGRALLRSAPTTQQLAASAPQSEFLRRAGGFLSQTLDILAGILVTLAVALYLALDPGLYRRGVLHLVPKRYRGKTREVLDALAHTLRWWLLGQCVSMTFVGAAIALGLWALNVPLALTLGLLAGLLNFVPNLGALLAAVPAVLLAFTQSPARALAVVVLTTVVQTIEGYWLTPTVQKRAVNLPPALTITAQLLMADLAGGLGLLLATPLVAVVLVIIQRLYVEDTLGDDLPPESHKQL